MTQLSMKSTPLPHLVGCQRTRFAGRTHILLLYLTLLSVPPTQTLGHSITMLAFLASGLT